MSGPVRIALVGTGDIGRIHAKALASIEGVELVIVKGKNSQRAEELASDLGASLLEDFDTLLADPSIDGVSLCVPNDLHPSLTISLLESGKSVLCEKPIALSLSEAEAMVEAGEKSGAGWMVGHVVRYWPDYIKTRDLILGGDVGSIQTFTARRLVPLLNAVQGEEGWRHAADRSGGAVLDLMIHDIDFVLWVFGMPDRVVGRGVKSHTGAFDHVFGLLEYDNGPIVEIESSFMMSGNPVVMDFRANGEKGSIEFSFVESDFSMHDIHSDETENGSRPAHESLTLYRWGQPKEVLCVQPEDPISLIFDRELRHFVDCVRSGDVTKFPTPWESVDALRVALAVRESCETGRVVEV